MAIILKNMAQVKIPDAFKNTIFKLYTHEGRDLDSLRTYIYKDGIAFLPLNRKKLNYVAQMLGEEIDDQRSAGAPVRHGFTLNPVFQFREYQVEAAQELLDRIRMDKYGVLKAGCGCGKTITMTWVAGQLNSKILILVDMGSLVSQWQEAFQMVWGKEAQVLSNDSSVFGDVCITTFQLLHLNPELVQRIRREFGCILLDEFHTTAAETRRAVLSKMDSQYRIGCTATLMKKGFSNAVLTDTVSDITVTMIDPNAMSAQVYFHPTGTMFSSTDPNKWGTIQSKLGKDSKRLTEIAKVTAVLSKMGRKILVVGITIDSIKAVHKWLLKNCPECKPIVYVGGTTLKQDKELREKVASGEVNVVCTVKKADKGLDLPNLDTLVLAKPANNEAFVTQIMGRIVRRIEGKPTPLIYDFVDGGTLSKSMARNRRRWYQKLECEIVQDIPK